MLVSNATPLIYLARLSKLNLLNNLYGKVQIPPEVKTETIDRGKAKGYPDAYVIEEAVNDGWLVTDALTNENTKKSHALAEMTGIDIGEAQAIILTKQKNEKEVLIDQSNARDVARHLGLSPRGTIYVILTGTKRELLTKEIAKQMLAKLIEVNFYISAKVYRDTLSAIEKL